MRRTVLLVAVMALAMVAASGVALADNIEGNGANNRLVGTNGKDTISGGGGADDIFGRDGADRLFGDSGNDDVHGGKGDDRLQSGLGQDVLFGDSGSDFVNAIDGQYNDVVDCGEGDGDVAAADIDLFSEGSGRADQFSENCEFLYVGIGPIPGGIFGPASVESRGASSTNLQGIDTRAEAEAAEAEGMLKQIK
jgi:hypothetical protein